MSKYVDGNRNTGSKGKVGGKPASTSPSNGGYVECDLDANDKEQIRAYVETNELGYDQVERLVSDAFYFSLKSDDRSGGFMATLIDNGDEPSLSGKRLVGRGSTPSAATAALLYKHIYKLAGDWRTAPDRGNVDFG